MPVGLDEGRAAHVLLQAVGAVEPSGRGRRTKAFRSTSVGASRPTSLNSTRPPPEDADGSRIQGAVRAELPRMLGLGEARHGISADSIARTCRIEGIASAHIYAFVGTVSRGLSRLQRTTGVTGQMLYRVLQ